MRFLVWVLLALANACDWVSGWLIGIGLRMTRAGQRLKGVI